MPHTILLYGATGYSGELIAAEAARMRDADAQAGKEFVWILAARNGERVAELARTHEMDFRVFGLDWRPDVSTGLRGVDVVVNAAGPFAWTADRIAKTALEVGCCYVDINGEADVYRTLDDLGRTARQRQLAMVCGAGHTAGASDLLLEAALQELESEGTKADELELGAVRIAMSGVGHLSRGSAETLWRSMREQVTVVRRTDPRKGRRRLALWHEPVGRRERTFDFRVRESGAGEAEPDRRIASAANLVDTLTARLTLDRHRVRLSSIESYVETNAASRVAYQLGALFAPIAATRWASALARAQIGLLPNGPSPDQLSSERHIVLLQIEDAAYTPVLDWRLETPDVYQLTAQVAVAAAKAVVERTQGWLTPAEVLGPLAVPFDAGPMRGCRLDRRIPRFQAGRT